MCPILVLLAALSAPADVIHLKNGRTIWADQVREDKNKDRVEYDVGEDTYAIPKSSIERIDAGGAAPVTGGHDSTAHDSAAHDSAGHDPAGHDSAGHGSIAAEMPDFSPATTFIHESDLTDKIVREGKVDADALSALDRAGNPELTATGYFLAGKSESDHGNFPQAKRYYESALRFQPESPTLLIYYAASLMRTGQAGLALTYAEHAARVAPDSPDALGMLGFVQFATDHTADAIRSWKKALALRPDPVVKQYLERAERESSTEAAFSQRESSHFNLHFEGNQTNESFRRDLLAALDADYDDLVRDLGYSPHDTIAVTLYTQQAFFDVTRAPSWSGAINDGKLRIPVNGMQSVTSDLAHVLKHELTHSFIAQMSSSRCPTWLNEGIAQMEEGKSSASNGHALAQLFAAGGEIPYNMLEGSFMNFSAPEAATAYAESLAAAEFIRETYGMGDMQQILQRLSQGSGTEAALRGSIHCDYRQLRDEMTRWLTDRYGR